MHSIPMSHTKRQARKTNKIRNELVKSKTEKRTFTALRLRNKVN